MNIGTKSMYLSRAIELVPWLLVFAIGIVWGITFSLARIAAEAGAHPVGLTFWQAGGGVLILLPICLYRKSLLRINWPNIKRFGVIALAGTTIPGILLFYAAAHVPAGILAITIALVPMLTYAFAWATGIDKFHPKRFLGVMLGFVAILLLAVPTSSLPDPEMVKWMLLGVVASLLYTIEIIYVDKSVPHGTDMISLLLGSYVVATLILTPVIYSQDAFVTLHYPFQTVDWAIASMALVSSVAYTAYLFLVKMAGSVFASMAGYVITLAGVFWGMVFFAEAHSLWVWLALVFMLAGMALVTPREPDGL